jgi:hypothetical protein
MSELKPGDWVMLRVRPPGSAIWLRVVKVTANEVTVTDNQTTFTVPRKTIFGVADATTLDNPVPTPTK